MIYNVLDSRTYSLMRRIDWRRTQDRVMSDSEAKRMNADAVKMLSYIAALDWFMFDLRDDLEVEGLLRHNVKRTMNTWCDKICRDVHNEAYKLLTKVNPEIGGHYHIVGEGFRDKINSHIYLEGIDRSYSIVINLCRLIEKYNNKIRSDYDFKPVKLVLELPRQLAIIGKDAYDLEFIIENAVKV